MKKDILKWIALLSIICLSEQVYCQEVRYEDLEKDTDYGRTNRQSERMRLLAAHKKEQINSSVLIMDDKTEYSFEQLLDLESLKRINTIEFIKDEKKIKKYTSKKNISLVILLSVKK